jgi:hypothetical protein
MTPSSQGLEPPGRAEVPSGRVGEELRGRLPDRRARRAPTSSPGSKTTVSTVRAR